MNNTNQRGKSVKWKIPGNRKQWMREEQHGERRKKIYNKQWKERRAL